MDNEEAIMILKKYEVELGDILGRFKRTSDSIHIDAKDNPRVFQLVIEIKNFLDDILGTNTYSTMIIKSFNEGITNFVGLPVWSKNSCGLSIVIL